MAADDEPMIRAIDCVALAVDDVDQATLRHRRARQRARCRVV